MSIGQLSGIGKGYTPLPQNEILPAAAVPIQETNMSEYGALLLASLAQKPFVVALPFSKAEQREAFLRWFQREAMTLPEAAFIAAGFKKEDFDFLAPNGPPLFQWVITLLQAGFGRSITCFLECDAKADVEKLAPLLSQEGLKLYFDAIPARLHQRLIQEIRTTAPEKLTGWFERVLNESETPSKCLRELYQKLAPHCPCEEFLRKDPRLFLSVYSSLHADEKKLLLGRLFKERDACARIQEWVQLCLEEPISLKAYVRDLFVGDFHSHCGDAMPLLKASLVCPRPFLDELFPDTKDAKVLQTRAIGLLTRHFLTPSIATHDRWQFVEQMKPDLTADLLPIALFYQLAAALPKETLPLLFAYFGHKLCKQEYDEYFESHTTGGVFQRVRKNDPPTMRIPCTANMVQEEADKRVGALTDASDIDRTLLWVRMAGIDNFFSQALPLAPIEAHDPDRFIELASTMLAEVRSEEGLHNLYQAACETNTIYPIMRRFVAKNPSLNIGTTLELFGHACFLHNNDGIIALCFDALKPNTLASIAEIIMHRPKRVLQGSSFSLTHLFWSCLKDEQVTCLVSMIEERMGERFIELFEDYQSCWLLTSLQEVNPSACQKLFFATLQTLAQSGREVSEKLRLLCTLCRSYKNEGYNLAELLENEAVRDVRQAMQGWCTKDALIKNIGSNYGLLGMVQSLAPESFESVLISIIDTMLSGKDIWLHSLFDELARLGINSEGVMELLSRHPQTLDRVTTYLQNLPVAGLRKSLFPLLCNFVPDWKDRILQEAQKRFLTNRRGLTMILQELKEIDALADWLEHITSKVTQIEYREFAKNTH